jgi:uncharacterized C2H2 Zn-finger protein
MPFLKRKRDDTKGILECKYCNMKFENRERLEKHTKKAHSEKGGDMLNPNPFGL